MNVKDKLFIVLGFIINSALANQTFFDSALNTVYDLEVNSEGCGGKSATKMEVLSLLNFIAEHYLRDCVNVILYDKYYEEDDKRFNFDLQTMLKQFPANFINAQINEPKKISKDILMPVENECRNFILLLTDITWTVTLLGPLRFSKVVVVTVSSRWKIEEYLEGWQARDIVNLLIVSYNWKQSVLFSMEEVDERISDINLYTHKLYTDGLGSSTFRLLTSWRCGHLTRNVHLFPKKMIHGKECGIYVSMSGHNSGFNGRQFVVAASEQPPFTFKRREKAEEGSNESYLWDGVEIRLLRLLSSILNYTIEIVEPRMVKSDFNGPSERVIDEVMTGGAEIGSAGVYVTNERISQVMFSSPHTTDCAVFVTKVSTAIPGHRAILGPFQWTVWLALTMAYMLAIIPITFSNEHSLKPLLKNPWLFENMFWHVFGTFTNCFTFSEKNSWSKSKNAATKLFVGWYWVFTIIVTACYTGSIVSFITLFVFPNFIDDVDHLVHKNFRIGTLSTGGWARWFNNSEHKKTKWLLRDMELIPNATQGLKNVSHSFYLPMFRPYAFLGGRAQMEFLIQRNYTYTKKKETLHISKDCFVPFVVSYVFPSTAAYSDLFNEYILRVQQSGLMAKLLNEFKWEFERSATGNFLQASPGAALRDITPHQRKLNLADTEGMYLLMGAGYLIGLVVLIMEWIHYLVKNRKTIAFKQKLTVLLFWRSERFHAILDRISELVVAIVENLREHLNWEQQGEQGNNYSSYKKYDSRILGTQTSGKASKTARKSIFYTRNFNQKENFVAAHETTSLPNIECKLGNPNEEETYGVQSHRRKDLDIIFGSINSLPWDFQNVLHRRNSRTLDSAQSY